MEFFMTLMIVQEMAQDVYTVIGQNSIRGVLLPGAPARASIILILQQVKIIKTEALRGSQQTVLKFILFKLIFSFTVKYEKNYIIVYFNTKYLICCLNEHDR